MMPAYCCNHTIATTSLCLLVTTVSYAKVLEPIETLWDVDSGRPKEPWELYPSRARDNLGASPSPLWAGRRPQIVPCSGGIQKLLNRAAVSAS